MVSIMAAAAGRSGDGFNFHLSATQLIEQFANNAEDHFTWLEEILVEAKKAFNSPEVELLPKTPSAKRGRRRKKDELSESDDNCKPPAKRASRAKGRGKKGREGSLESIDSSTSESVDMEPKEGSPVAEQHTPPKRNGRLKTRSANATGRSTRNSRNTRSKKDTVEEANVPSPVMNMVASVKIIEPIAEIKTPTKSKENADDGQNKQENQLDVTGIKSKDALKHVSPLKTNINPINAFKSPSFLKEFVAMKVKEKINALEEFMRPGHGSPKQSPATPLNVPQKPLDTLKTPVSQVSSNTPQTPPTVVTKTLVKVKSRIGVTSDEEENQDSNGRSEEEEMETDQKLPEKSVPTINDIQNEIVCVESAVVAEDTHKESEIPLKSSRRSITVNGAKSGLRRLSATGKNGPRHSKSSRKSFSTHRSTRTKTIKKSAHKDEDCGSEDVLVTESDLEDMVAKNENLPESETKNKPSEGSARKVTRSKLRLKKASKKESSLSNTPNNKQTPKGQKSNGTPCLNSKSSSSDTDSSSTPLKDAVFQIPTGPAPRARNSSSKDSPADRVRNLSNHKRSPINRVQHSLPRSSPSASDSEGEVRRSTRTKQRKLQGEKPLSSVPSTAESSSSCAALSTMRSEASESSRSTPTESSSTPEVLQTKPSTPVSNTDYDATDDDATPVVQLEQPRRTTRTKTLRAKPTNQGKTRDPEISENGRSSLTESSSTPGAQNTKPSTPATVVSNTDYDASDDEATPVVQLEQPRRTTRTKTLRTRQSNQTKKKEPETSDDEEEEDVAHEPVQHPQPQRTTRSKMRINKPVPRVVCVSDADGENTPTNTQASSTMADKAGRVTRSKMRKRPPAAGSGDSGTDAISPPEAKKMTIKEMSSDEEGSRKTRKLEEEVEYATPCKTPKSDEEYHTPSSANNSDIVERTPSPECPKNKVIRPHPASFLNALSQKKEVSSNKVVTSFIQRNTPKKMTTKEINEQKKRELEKKRQKDADRLKKREEMLSQKVEEQKKKREERMKKVHAMKEAKERKEHELKKRLEMKLHERQQLGDEVRDKAVRETKEKIRERQKKLQEAEERRKQEEVARLQKLQEQEEEAKRHEKMLERKKQYEEEERLKKIAESKKQQEERLAEIEKQRQEEAERLRLKKEEDDKLREKQREEREKELAREKAEREKAELERMKEKEKQEKERQEQEKEMEKQKLKEAAAQKEEEKRIRQEQAKALQKHHQQQNTTTNSSSSSAPMKSKMNTTLESYDMTPPPAKRVYKLPDPDNYDINDLKSDESTDDEDQPRKRIPAWAQGAPLKAALINQHYHPPNLEEMFLVIDPPDLNAMFAKKKQRFNKRTSSAIWDSPLLKPGTF